MAKIYAYSIKHKVQAIYFEDVSLVKMKEFRQVLKAIRSIPEIMRPIMNRRRDMRSPRLRNLLSEDHDQDNEEAGMFPSNLVEEID